MTVYGPKLAGKGQKWSFFGFIWTSGNAIDVIPTQELDNVVFQRLRYLNGGKSAHIWHKSPKPRQNWVATGRKLRSRQFLDGSVTGFRYLIQTKVCGGCVPWGWSGPVPGGVGLPPL